jgi:hypothetical protein
MGLIEKYLGEGAQYTDDDWVVVYQRKPIQYIKNPKNNKSPTGKINTSKYDEIIRISKAKKMGIKIDEKYLSEGINLKFTDLDTSNKDSFHGGAQWSALIKGKTYTWNYVTNKNGRWQVTNEPKKADAIAVSTYAGKKLKTAKILKK